MKTIIKLNEESFTTQQVCEIIDITARQMIYWDLKGIVKPSVRPAFGKGSQRLFSYVDLIALKTVKKLRDNGVSLQKIRKCILYLRKNLPDIEQPLSFCSLVTDGNTVVLVKDEKTLIDTVKRQGQLLLINIADMDRELREKVKKLSSKRIEEIVVGDYAYQVELEPDFEEGGFVATVAGLPGCITQGESLEETLEMAKDAIKVYLEAVDDLKAKGIALKTQPRRMKLRA